MIVHCNDLDTLLAGYLYKKYIGEKIKLIFDAHELFPEHQNGKIRYIFWNTIEKILINKPDIILCPEINRLNYLKNKHKIINIKLIENFPLKYNLCNKI